MNKVLKKAARNGENKSGKPKSKPVTQPSHTKSDITVKLGKPVVQVTFQRIKLFVTIFGILVISLLILSMLLFVNAVKIRNHIGAFINMISKGDGDVLPTLLALPALGFFLLNIIIVFFVYKIFSKKKSPGANNILFILILIGIVLICITIVVIFCTVGHIYGFNKNIQNGIMSTMQKYKINSFYKIQMDRLQIEFQCCGSKKYDDWYNITWFESDISKNSSLSSYGNTPFSCCAIRSKFPCIHYDIEKTGTSYLYTPEFNLSISVTGCHTRVMEKKQQVGLSIIAKLFLYIFLEMLLLIPIRFLQTGHSIDYKFEGNSKTYTVWLLGTYSGKNKSNGPPEPPPVPPDLMD